MKMENINNLTSLWKTAGLASGSFGETHGFKYSIVENAEWPNRLWFDGEIDGDVLESAKNFAVDSNTVLTLPYWGENSEADKLFTSHRFKLKFKQIGMSIKLASRFEYQARLSIQQMSTEDDAQTWEDIYPHAFGYKISKATLLSTGNEIKFYLARLNDEPVGTAIVYNSGNIAGIHGVGVIPSARRKGFADEIMKHVLNESIDAGMTYSTLQASDMGKGIYLRLGYSGDFTITNYVLNEL